VQKVNLLFLKSTTLLYALFQSDTEQQNQIENNANNIVTLSIHFLYI